jgi:hypothetical protein
MVEEHFRNQALITASDVPAAVELLTGIRTLASDEAMRAIGDKYGLNDDRMAYIVGKFISGAGLLSPDAHVTEESLVKQFGSPLVIPTPEELEVIRGSLTQIKDALGWITVK